MKKTIFLTSLGVSATVLMLVACSAPSNAPKSLSSPEANASVRSQLKEVGCGIDLAGLYCARQEFASFANLSGEELKQKVNDSIAQVNKAEAALQALEQELTRPNNLENLPNASSDEKLKERWLKDIAYYRKRLADQKVGLRYRLVTDANYRHIFGYSCDLYSVSGDKYYRKKSNYNLRHTETVAFKDTAARQFASKYSYKIEGQNVYLALAREVTSSQPAEGLSHEESQIVNGYILASEGGTFFVEKNGSQDDAVACSKKRGAFALLESELSTTIQDHLPLQFVNMVEKTNMNTSYECEVLQLSRADSKYVVNQRDQYSIKATRYPYSAVYNRQSGKLRATVDGYWNNIQVNVYPVGSETESFTFPRGTSHLSVFSTSNGHAIKLTCRIVK